MIEQKSKGQSLVEFALLLPVLIIVFLAIIEGARVIQAYLAIQDSARVAARYAVSGQPELGGNLWIYTPEERAEFIQEVALDQANVSFLGFNRVITDTNTFGRYLETGDGAYCNNPDPNDPCVNAIGVLVSGQEAENGPLIPGSAGFEGLNVSVEMFFFVPMLDPIFALIAPEGVRVRAAVVMQNEGQLDSIVGGAPTPAPTPDYGTGLPPDQPTSPLISIQGGNQHPAGATIAILISVHEPNTNYTIDIEGLAENLPVTTDTAGQGLISFTIPDNAFGIDISVGSYDADGILQAETFLVITAPDQPSVNSYTIEEAGEEANPIYSTFWPVGTPLFYGLNRHTPNAGFDLQLRDEATGNVQTISSVTTDNDGVYRSGPTPYILPQPPNLAADDYNGLAIQTLQSFSSTQSTVVATQTLQVVNPCIRLDQGGCGEVITTVTGARFFINIDQHAPNSSYQVRFVEDNGGILTPVDVIGEVRTNLSGQGRDRLTYILPLELANGTYWVETYAKVNGSYAGDYRIGRTRVNLDTTTDPFISIDGGLTWPAGSTINFQLINHEPVDFYDIYWEGDLVLEHNIDIENTDNNGRLRGQFTIPEQTPLGYTYTLSSREPGVSTDYARSLDITVEPKPYIEVREGNPQFPGARINIDLFNHAINGVYDVYVGGQFVPGNPYNADGEGEASGAYTLPPDLPVGVSILIESYERGADPATNDPVATFTLDIVAADLQIASIVIPENPPFNTEFPITVTVINASPATITNQIFDIDLYIDPPLQPDLGLALPPGDIKTWFSGTLGENETHTFTSSVALFGAQDHTIWARVDTSNKIIEGDREANNLDNVYISPETCEATLGSEVITDTIQAFGDGSLAGSDDTPRLRLTSPGNSTYQSNDEGGSSGYYFAYRELSGDFEMQARITKPPEAGSIASDKIKWGFEVRDSIDGRATKLEWDFYSDGSGRAELQASYRTSYGGGISGSGSNDYPNTEYPIWIRLVRLGSNFTLYYAQDNGDGTHGGWTQATEPSSVLNVPMDNDVLAGLFASSYLGKNNVKNVDFNYFKICTAGSDCANAGDIIYEVTYDGTIDAGWQTEVFGASNRINPSLVDFTEATPTAYEPVTINGDTITMLTNGSQIMQNSDTDGGYVFSGHLISGDFDIRVRAVSQSNELDLNGNEVGTLAEYAKFGLQVRADLSNASDAINFASTNRRGLQTIRRINGSRSTSSDIPSRQDHQPVWLRIVRSGNNYTLYYSYEETPSAWDEANSYSVGGSDLTQNQVYIGLVNASYDSTNRSRVTFSGYAACVNPGAVATCGEVREASGLVVINGNNYIENIAATDGKTWESTTRGGLAGITVPDDDSGQTSDTTVGYNDAAEVRYQVDFTNEGTYYVWLLASKPNGRSDEVYVALTGNTPSGYYDSDETNDSIEWFNDVDNGTNRLTIPTQGTHQISVWARDDGFELYQIILTQDPNYDPTNATDPTGIPQSQCSAQGQPEPPPGLRQCVQPIVNGNFEDRLQLNAWTYASVRDGVTRTSQPHYIGVNQSFSMVLPATSIDAIPRRPVLYQEFEMPDWVITPTLRNGRNEGTVIDLRMHYAVNPEAAPEPDPLYVSLVDETNSVTPTGLIEVVNGGNFITINPNSFDNDDWQDIGYTTPTEDLALRFRDPISPTRNNLVDYASQRMRLYFHAPNDGTASTRFYLDNVSLEICTTQPSPDNPSTRVSGTVLVFQDGYVEKPGVFVWIYSEGGEMQKTYTIQDSTFNFYNLPAEQGGTEYLIYAEYLEDGQLYSATTRILLQPGQAIDDILMLLF